MKRVREREWEGRGRERGRRTKQVPPSACPPPPFSSPPFQGDGVEHGEK